MKHSGLNKLDTLDPAFRGKIQTLLDIIAAHDLYVCIVSAQRTIADQNKLYKQGRDGQPGAIVTNAKGGQSPHNFGMAIDLCPLNDNGNLNWNDINGFELIGEVAEEMGLTWGGNFKSIKDRPHVEDPQWKEVQAAWKRGEVQVA